MTSLIKGLKLEGGGVISLVGAGGKTNLMYRLARELSGGGDSVLTTTTTKILMPTRDQSVYVVLAESAETILSRAKDLLRKTLHITAAAGRVQATGKLFGLQPETIDLLWKAHLFRWIIVESDGAAGKPLKAPAAHEPVFAECTKWVIGLVGLSAVGKPLTEHWVFRPERFVKVTGMTAGTDVTENAIGNVFTHANGILKGAPVHALRIAFLNQADVPGGFAAGRKIAGLLGKKKESQLNRIVIGQILFEPPILACYETEG